MHSKNILFGIFFNVIILLLVGCKDQPTSVTKDGQLIIEVTFESKNRLTKTSLVKYSEIGVSKNEMQKSSKSTIKITDVNVRVLEADSSEIIQEALEEQTDGSFQGVIQVPAGNNRIIEVTALNNSDIIAAGDTANVDILPGRSTAVEIQLAFVSGVERNLTIVSGQDQQGFPGSSLPEPIVAKVSDVEGNGVSEIDVVLRVIQGEAFFGNQLDSLLTTTNSAGLASAILFLENTPGEILVQVSANDRSGDPLVGSPDTVRATILAPPPPVISDFEPIIGTEGTPVTIRGENLNFPPITVRFGNTAVPSNLITIISNTQIRTSVPDGARSGAITVTTAGGTTQSSTKFTVFRALSDIAIRGSPKGIAFKQDGSEIWVADSTNKRIVIISPSAHKMVDSILLPNSPAPAALDIASVPGQGEIAFVVTSAPSEIVLIRTQDKALSNILLHSSTNANDIVITSAAALGYVATDTLLYTFRTSGQPNITPQLAGSSPFGLALGNIFSRLYVTNLTSNDVYVYNTITNARIDIIPVGNRPRQIAISPDDSFIYVTNQLDNDVSFINTETMDTTRVTVGNGPDGIALTPDAGLIFVANTNDDNISVIDTARRKVAALISTEDGPRNIVLSPDGLRIYVTNFFSGSLTVIGID